MTETKIIKRRTPVPGDALQGYEMSPLLRRIYSNRNITSPRQIEYVLTNLHDFSLLKDIERAATIVADAVMNNSTVIVVGDFDADGATSTAVVVRALRMFGLASASYIVPNRFEYGYGLTPEIVAVVKQSAPDLIITVDNGISSVEGVDYANEHNIRVVVTDHHLPGEQLPRAAAIVNPNQEGCAFPSKNIAGVGVAFYLMLAVRAQLRERNWFNEHRVEPNMAVLLDLVALGTVADVVPLDDNNRLLVEQGLRRVRSGMGCYGIQALLKVAGRSIRSCTSQDFGFFVGPRLNASGRLENISTGIECLLADSLEQAEQRAELLDDLNRRRKEIEGDMLSQAMVAIDEQLRLLSDDKELEPALCLYDTKWHQGVIGILASRLKEKFHRPVIVFADAGPDEVSLSGDNENTSIKGSARSIPSLHIRDVLDAIATKNPGLIEKFGGHAMAAGLSLDHANLERFSQAFINEVKTHLSDADLEKMVETDGSVSPDEMTLESAEILRYAGPWGQHFPEPVFDDEFDVLNWSIVGEKHLKFQLLHKASGKAVDAIAFNQTEKVLPANNQAIRAAYRMDVNEFRGNRSLQLVIDHIEKV